jgi:hypothetical protein
MGIHNVRVQITISTVWESTMHVATLMCVARPTSIVIHQKHAVLWCRSCERMLESSGRHLPSAIGCRHQHHQNRPGYVGTMRSRIDADRLVSDHLPLFFARRRIGTSCKTKQRNPEVCWLVATTSMQAFAYVKDCCRYILLSVMHTLKARSRDVEM